MLSADLESAVYRNEMRSHEIRVHSPEDERDSKREPTALTKIRNPGLPYGHGVLTRRRTEIIAVEFRHDFQLVAIASAQLNPFVRSIGL